MSPENQGISTMDYIREIGGKSFWDTWNLVFDRSVASAMTALLIFCIALLVLRARRQREKVKLRLKDFLEAALITVPAFFVLWVVNFALFTPHRILSEARQTKHTDLRMSVIRYGYDNETHELYSDVQYMNNGKTRRTILGVTMCYHARGENGQNLLINSPRPATSFYAEGPPLYVEPNQPIVQSYKYKLDENLINLTRTPGEVFGLQLVTINDNGSMNFNTVEAMIVIEFALNSQTQFAMVSGMTTSNISLDVRSGYTPIKEPMIMLPSPSPGKAASPH